MHRLMDDNDNIIMEFDVSFIFHGQQKPTTRTPEFEKALLLWKANDNYHFEDENGNMLDPFNLLPEEG